MLVADRVLTESLNELIAQIVASQRGRRMRASGASAASLNARTGRGTNGTAGAIYGADTWQYQVSGRGPGKYKKPSRKLVDMIRAWVKFKGIPDEAAYPIAYKINKLGTKTPNRFNDGRVLADVLSPENVAKILAPYLQQAYLNALSNILFN